MHTCIIASFARMYNGTLAFFGTIALAVWVRQSWNRQTLKACLHWTYDAHSIRINAHWACPHSMRIHLNRFQTGSIPIHIHTWFESGSKWIARSRALENSRIAISAWEAWFGVGNVFDPARGYFLLTVKWRLVVGAQKLQGLLSVYGASKTSKMSWMALAGTERISRELRNKGYDKTWQQCRTKIKNLTQKYRKVR